MPQYSSQPAEAAANDSYIEKNTATTNYGTDNYMYIGYDGGTYLERAFVKFDISSIAASATVSSATLSLWLISESQTSNKVIGAYRQKKAWTEAGITYNKYDGTNNWTAAGGFHADDCEQSNIGTITVNNGDGANTQYDMTLSVAGVQGWVSGLLTNNGLLLKYESESSAEYASLHSSSSATEGYRPKLVINYTLPGGESSTFFSGGSTLSVV